MAGQSSRSAASARPAASVNAFDRASNVRSDGVARAKAASASTPRMSGIHAAWT